jgi:hypothetical protein
MTDKIIFTFENLSSQSMKAAGLHERQIVKRGTVREIWESLLDWVADKESGEKLRNSEHLIQFSTRRFGCSNRPVLMWHETPAEYEDMIYAYFPMSLIQTTSRMTEEATAAAATAAAATAAATAAAPQPQQEKIKKE